MRETAGVARENEPVTVTIDGRERTLFVSIGPHQTRTFDVSEVARHEKVSVQATDPVGFIAENSIFRADLSKRTVDGRGEDSGMLRGLTFKPLGVTLRRTQNRMHWAPSFQREGAKGYTSMAMWDPVQEHRRTESDGMVTFTREGYHTSYPEIGLFSEYRFFPYVPYFLFRATLTVQKPIDMFWLRGQEMTMDDLFTHVAWPGPDGKSRVVTFDERKPILGGEPLPADVPWVAFLNRDKGYGYGAVILGFSGTTLTNASTEIADGAGNGKYWYRQMIGRKSTPLKPGDRYDERTAYVLFRTLEEFLSWERRLRHPLEIEVK